MRLTSLSNGWRRKSIESCCWLNLCNRLDGSSLPGRTVSWRKLRAGQVSLAISTPIRTSFLVSQNQTTQGQWWIKNGIQTRVASSLTRTVGHFAIAARCGLRRVTWNPRRIVVGFNTGSIINAAWKRPPGVMLLVVMHGAACNDSLIVMLVLVSS